VLSAELEGQLTASVHATEADMKAASDMVTNLTNKVGRLIYNGYPTGVEGRTIFCDRSEKK
jgi:alpha-ketoglutaric semialdehyde dehydrogenase